MSSICYFLQLLLAFLLKVQLGFSEEVKMRFGLNNTDNDHSLYIGNATDTQLNNLIEDIVDTVLDESKELIGIVKENNKEAIGFNTSHQMAMEEDNQRLRSSIDEMKGIMSSIAEDIKAEVKMMQSSHAEEMATKDEELNELRSSIREIKEMLSSLGRDIKLVSLNVTKVQSLKSMGYEIYHGVSVYKYHKNVATFEEASKTCQSEGGHLAIINSEVEATLLVKLLKENRNSDAWIGVHDPKRNGDYRTVFGTPLKETGYSNWKIGYPRRGNCVCLDPSNYLADYSCTNNDEFICEQYL